MSVQEQINNIKTKVQTQEGLIAQIKSVLAEKSAGGSVNSGNPLELHNVVEVPIRWSDMGATSYTIPANSISGGSAPRFLTNKFYSENSGHTGLLVDNPSIIVTCFYVGAKYGFGAKFENKSSEDFIITNDQSTLKIYDFTSIFNV